MVGLEELRDVLADVDILVLAAPETPETTGLIDREALSRLQPHALVINVGRGSLLDEDALIEALAAGTLAGAALDVFAREPLPPSSPLWRMPNVIVSPHAAGVSVKEDERILALFVDNLGRYLAGGPLINAYDPSRGY
jgi:phosphoglycerate dehydrogenase-like enzyme